MARRRYLDDDTYGIMTYGNPIRTTTGGIPRIVAGFNPDGTVRTAISRTSDQEDAELYGPEVTITPASGVFTEGFNGRTDYPSAAAYYQSREGEPGLENPDIDPLTLGLGFGRAAANGALKTVPKVLERGLHYMNPSAYTGAGAYSTPMGGEGTNLLGAVLDNALFSGMAATAFNEFGNNPSLYTGVNAGLNAIPFAAAGLPFLAKRARSANELVSDLRRVSNTADDVELQNAARQNVARIRALEESGLSTEEAVNQVYRDIAYDGESPVPRNLYPDVDEVNGIDDDYFGMYDAAMDEVRNAEAERRINILTDSIIPPPEAGEPIDQLYYNAFDTYVNRRRHGLSPQEAANEARLENIGWAPDREGRTVSRELDEFGVRQDAFEQILERMYQNKFPNDAPGTPENPVLTNIENTTRPTVPFNQRTDAEQQRTLRAYRNEEFNSDEDVNAFMNRYNLTSDDMSELAYRDVNNTTIEQHLNNRDGFENFDWDAYEVISPATNSDGEVLNEVTGDPQRLIDAYNEVLMRNYATPEEAIGGVEQFMRDNNLSERDISRFNRAIRESNTSELNDIDDLSPLLYDTPFEAQVPSEPFEQEVSSTSFRNRSLDEQNRLYDELREIRLAGGDRNERVNRIADFMNNNNLELNDVDELDNLITSGTRPTPITNSNKITLSINGRKNPETDKVIKDYTNYLLDKINSSKTKEEVNNLIKRHLQYRNKFVDDNNLNIKDPTTKRILESIETKISRQLDFDNDVYVVQNHREYNINGKKYIGEYGKLKDSDGNVLSKKESKALLKQGGYKREPNRWDYAGSGGMNYGGNSMQYHRTPDGHIDITEANFFNPEGEPNTLMDFANKQLTTGDVISIANEDDHLSSDSNPLLGLNLIRDLQNSIERVASDGSIIPATTKGYVIEPKGESVKLNGFGQKKYRGLLFNMTRAEKEEKLEKIKGIYKQLEELNNQRNPDHPIHFDDKDFYFDGVRLHVPGYKARHLKYGGLVRGRNNRRTMACYGRRY